MATTFGALVQEESVSSKPDPSYPLQGNDRSGTSGDPSHLRVTFGEPHHGWMEVRLESGDAGFAEIMSHIFPSLVDLVAVLERLWPSGQRLTIRAEAEPAALVRWTVEPDVFEFVFAPHGDVIELSVLERRDVRPADPKLVLQTICDRKLLCLAFWRALRQLESRFPREELSQHWHQFPTAELERLSDRIKTR